MLFNLTYGCYSLFVEVPGEVNNSYGFEFEKMPFPPIPFYTSNEGIWDLSEKEISKDAKHSITLNFGSMEEVTDNSEMGKRRVYEFSY